MAWKKFPPRRESFSWGVVVPPIPTFPPLVTTKLVAVDEPITNAGPVIPFGLMESLAHGVEVPIPTFPFDVS